MADYLAAVRSKGFSRAEWFERDLPWGPLDAVEVTIFRKAR
jgi:hypothetical protein